MAEQMVNDNKPLGYFGAFNTYYSYSWINNEPFYALIPNQYRNFYQRFVKNWLWWYDGFAPYFHNTQAGMFSTKIARSIMRKLANVTVGSKLMFDDEGYDDKYEINIDGKTLNSVDFIEYWSDKFNLDTKTVQAQEWAFAGGDSIIKLDSDGEDLIPSVLRKDSYYIDTDFRGKICAFTGFIYSYVKLTKQEGQSEQNVYYYLLEERKYDLQGKPQFRITIKRGTNLGVTRPADVNPEPIPFKDLPRDIRHKFKKDYPNTQLGVWRELPLRDLGIYMVKATETVSFLPQTPFGESLLNDILTYLMLYDFYASSVGTNLYTARDKLFVPKHMAQPPNVLNGVEYNQNEYAGWDSFVQVSLPYTDPEKSQPTVWQPSLRADDWIRIRDNLLQMIALNLGVDERTISSAIVPNAEKPTAREISADEYTTTLFAEGKRRLLKNALDELLKTVLEFYGFNEDKVVIKFSKAGLLNMNNVMTIVSIGRQNNVIDLDTALEMLYPDKNNVQLQAMKENIEKEQKEAMEREQKMSEANVEEKMEQNEGANLNSVPKK